MLQSIAALLLDAGCDVNNRDSRTGESALHIAAKKGYHGIVERILACGRLDYESSYACLVSHIGTVL